MSLLVSIIVPCYKQAQYLPETLQSVLDQTYENWECIIINDGSPDNTEEVALEWRQKDNRFIYLNKENGGVSSARNVGLNLAKGRYIQFLDGDDILENDKILNQVNFLEQNKTIDIVFSSNRFFFSNNNSNLFAIHYTGIIPTIEISKNDSNQKEVLSMRNVCTICSSLYRRHVFEIVQFKNVIYEDWLFHFECSLNNFLFHFEKFENSRCLIRMTNQSQMMKHGNEDVKNNNFRIEFEGLKEKFNFNSKLLSGRNNIFSKNDQYFTNFKFLIISLVPPILILIKNKFLKK